MTNPTIQQIHDMLVAQSAALHQALSVETDPDQAKTILMEMQELLHRINLAQNLMFVQSAQALTATLPTITAANTALTQAIGAISNITNFLAASANFLKGVDQAIDLAKTLAV
jgi:hypothetical protein